MITFLCNSSSPTTFVRWGAFEQSHQLQQLQTITRINVIQEIIPVLYQGHTFVFSLLSIDPVFLTILSINATDQLHRLNIQCVNDMAEKEVEEIQIITSMDNFGKHAQFCIMIINEDKFPHRFDKRCSQWK